MSWLTQFVIDPIENALKANPEVSATVAPVVASAKTALGTATSAIDPLLNDFVSAGETAANAYVTAVGGPIGEAVTPAMDLAITTGASALAAALNKVFGKTVLTVA